ncbi:hypothetical protein FHU40_000181 [Nocardioides soli]|uniref:Uncharacterized protein n=1 Tax=Nocardioides soli TaxID=1036020 RepID=A0A7W4VRD8_9ACTN|nr:hypothetical protein [Nocardioides soli]
MVDPLTGWSADMELGGRRAGGRDPWRADGVVDLVDRADPGLGLSVRGGPPLTAGRCGQPGARLGARHLDELAQSLQPAAIGVCGMVVGDELEATHQRVSPAKDLAAFCRISRSVVSFVVSPAARRSRPRVGRSSAPASPQWVPRGWSLTASTAVGWRSTSCQRRSSFRSRRPQASPAACHARR